MTESEILIEMRSGVSASSPIFSSLPPKPKTTHVFSASRLAYPRTSFWSDSDLKVGGVGFSTTKGLVCNSNSKPGGAGSGTVLLYFLLVSRMLLCLVEIYVGLS